MRVLSFIPTLLIAAASLVTAVPLPNPDATAPACTPAPSNSASNSAGSSPAQPVIDIVVKATADIQPLVGQLTVALKASPAEDETTVGGIVSQINDIVVTATTQLNAEIKIVDWTSVDIKVVANVVFTLLLQIYGVLACLGPYVTKLVVGGPLGTLESIVCTLLKNINGLLDCLKYFVGTALGNIFKPVLDLSYNIVIGLGVTLNLTL